MCKTHTQPHTHTPMHTQTHSKVKITSPFYWEGKLLCDYDEVVKLQLRQRAMEAETTAV